MTQRNPELTPLQKAALAMKALRERLDGLEQAATAPIAIVGLGCRFPAGGTGPERFWEAIRAGRDGSREIPRERWDVDRVYDPTPGAPGKMYVRSACFIDEVDRFDPLFFRISPREAVGIDPQQRLLLEVAWEALEDAAIAPPSLVGSRTGVFLGISTNDYSALLSRTAHGSGSNATAGAGNAASVASGRISYTFGFQGPCLAVDTACSSSLVAAHLAVQSLRNGECTLALVAGVNLMLSPEITINFCQGRMLSPDGHCKTFDASADGYARGEGCGVLVLKRLADAIADGNRIHAVIRGSAVNQDGRSAGLTAPNGLAQEAVIRQALANARLQPADIDYIEAHGTGTSLGDPIEMHALKAVFGPGRDKPLYVGSVKTNIGHAEAAAGVGGLAKAALMLSHQVIPPHRNFTRLNPHIDLEGVDFRIPLAEAAAPVNAVGVSSFGFSGTNAHLVLTPPPALPEPEANGEASAPPRLFLSARTKGALEELIARYDAFLADTRERFADICYSAAVGRARLPWWVMVEHADELATAVPSNDPPPPLPALRGRRVALPTYPFERERYWIDAAPPVEAAEVLLPAGGHPLLGRRLRLPLSSQSRWEAVVASGLPALAFLDEHRVGDSPVLPAAAYLEMALAAHPGHEVVELRIPAPFVVPREPARALQTLAEADGTFRIVSCALVDAEGEVVTHALGRVRPSPEGAALPAVALPAAAGTPVDADALHAAMERRGVRHGPAFRLLSDVRRWDGAAEAKLRLPAQDGASPWAGLHPAALDAALQLVAAALPDDDPVALLPSRFAGVRLLRSPQGEASVRVVARREGNGARAEIAIEDAQGVALHIAELRFAPAGAEGDAREGTYRLDWVAQPLLAGLAPLRFLPGATELCTALAEESRRLGERHGMADYAAAGDALERIATAFVVRALNALGMAWTPGARFTPGPQAESLGIAERHLRLFARMLEMLGEEGVLARTGRAWQVKAVPEAIDAAAECDALARKYPAMAGEIGMVRRCGESLAEVLTGRADPLALLFPKDDAGAGVFYSTSAYAQTVNGLLREAVRRMVATLPPGRALRVLEVGAGTGGATHAVLEGLGSAPYSYAFTDVSTAFLADAAKTFAGRPVAPRLLDIERDPATQGFEGERYDLVLAANVLHATRDIAQSLAHVHGLLADGGTLLLVESTQPRRWVDIVFGLTEGWWRFADTALRPAHPLLAPDRWREVLDRTGFDPGAGPMTEVIAARRASPEAQAASRRWHVRGESAAVLEEALREGGQALAAPESATDWIVRIAPAAEDAVAQQALFLSLVEVARDAMAQPSPPRLAFIAGGTASHAGLAGFVRTLAIESPALAPRLLVDPPGPVAFVDELLGGAAEPEVRWAGSERQVARLVAQDPEGFLPAAVSGTWLVTGGFGGLGLAVARWLAAHGATQLVLLGRHVPEPLPDLGVRVTAVAGDASDEALVARVVEAIADLEGVVHAAGTLADAPVAEQTAQTIAAVLPAKIGGALALDRATRARSLKHFVLFASAAGVLGSARQSNHAFCSTFLDGLARRRQEEGLPGLALDWGVWSEVGEAARQGFDARARQLGLGSIPPARGVAAFAAALGAPAAQLLVLPSVDWTRFAANLGAQAAPLYAAVLAAPAAKASAPSAQAGTTAAATGDAATTLARIVGDLLRLPPDFDRKVALAELGLDSLVAVEIKNQVAAATGVDLSVRELIEGASLEDLARRVDEARAPGAATSMTAAKAAIVPDPAHRHDPFPLTEMQQAFWVGRRSDLALGNVDCYLYTEFDAHVVDVAGLERAWNQLVRRHDMLRVVIQPDGRQRILAEVPEYRFEVLDLRGRDEAAVAGELERRRRELSRRVTPPDTWPLFDIRVTLHGALARVHLGFDLIALDAASIFAVRHELARLYDDPAAKLPPIGLSFRDYVLHLEAQRASPEWKRSEQYWKARAATLPEAPELPLLPAAVRPDRPQFRRHRVVLETARAELLRREAQARGLTISAVLATVYADVLALWSRNPRFCVTVTLFNRPPLHPDMAALMGDFTSTVLLEVDATAATFEARAQALMRRLAADLDHAAVSGIQVLREIARQTGQGLRTVPVVFTSALGFQKPPGSEAGMWDRLGTTVYSVSSTPQVWIDHQITEEDGNLFCHWDVLEDLIPAGVVDDMVATYRAILEGLVDGGGWGRALRPALPAPGRRAVLETVPPPECLHAAFERQAARTPQRTALIAADATLDYATLDRAATHLAARLAQRLGGPDAARDRLVAVGYAKGWRQAVAVLAILKAGAAYLPVDPALPAERRKLLVEQGEALVFDEAWADEALAAARAGTPAPALPAIADPARLAYVIYTSGSTGVPKGVMIEHAAAHCTVREVNRRWGVGEDDRVLGLSSLSFDLSVYDLFGPLAVGGALVLPESGAGRDPGRWSELLLAHRVTVWNTVPALMAMLAEYGVPEGHALRLAMLSGDWVPLDLVAKLRRTMPRARLVALGGATEAGIWSNAHEIGELDPAWPSIPYGLPLAGHLLHVANAQGEDCPDWATGQIEISGRGLARGYWKDAARTAERFRTTATGERRYVTGDLGRFRPYATNEPGSSVPIEFLGREDTQVKVQGYRIELGEIEAALAAHPAVATAVVTAQAVGSSNARTLHAFVVPANATAPGDDPAWEVLVAAGEAAAAKGAEIVEQAAFDEVADLVTAHAVGAAAKALRTLAGSSQPLDAEALMAKASVSRRYAHWLRRMLPRVAAMRADAAPATIAGIARIDKIGFSADDFALLEAVAEKLPDLLTERVHSSDIYLSRQTPEVYAKLFARPNAIIAALVAARAARGTVSVLEVGGGLGTTLAAIAPRLPAERVRYHFTDLSPHFVHRAKEAYAKLPWVSFETLDFDRPAPPDAPRHDVIIASSALHAAADVRRTLAHLRGWLAPGGVLVALEQTRFFPWFDLSMGLQAGFDARTDLDLRPDSPLLSREAWCRLLTEAGYAGARALVVPGSIDERLGVDVIVARAPEEAGSAHAPHLRDAGPLGGALLDWLRERLPAHMVPAGVDAIDRLPLSANGKVDRARLSSLLRSREAAAGGARRGVQGDLERQVMALVAELLPGTEADPERSLFELGATSLTLVSLHRLVAERMGLRLPLQAMFEAPTVASLARALAGLAPKPGGVVSFAPRVPGRPVLVMMPGVLALPFYLRTLAEALAPEVALVTIAAPGLFDDATPLDTVEAQAEHALARLREFQPAGPYLLAGHSYGGYVAIEMARRLREAGESVPRLILGDSVRTRSALEAFQTDDVAHVAMTRALYAVYGAHLDVPYAEIAMLGPRAAFEATATAVEAKDLLGMQGLPLARLTALFKANFRALGAYRPQPIPGDMTVVRTEGGFPPEFLDYETGDSLADPALGWTGMVQGRLKVRVMPGDHLAMTDAANTAAFAAILKEILAS